MAVIMLLLALFQQIPGPQLTTTWQGDILVIVASPGSLYLVGGNLEEQYIGQEFVTLPAAGVSQQYTPIGREYIELRSHTDGQTTVRLPVPEKPPDAWLSYLPVVVAPERSPVPPVFRLHFPLLAK